MKNPIHPKKTSTQTNKQISDQNPEEPPAKIDLEYERLRMNDIKSEYGYDDEWEYEYYSSIKDGDTIAEAEEIEN